MASAFNDLAAYRLARELAQDLNAAVVAWPSFDRWSLGVQLVRAAGSVGANIAEGTGRWSRRDQRHFVIVARGSLRETEHWIGLAQHLGLLGPEWTSRVESAARALGGLLKRWPSP